MGTDFSGSPKKEKTEAKPLGLSGSTGGCQKGGGECSEPKETAKKSGGQSHGKSRVGRDITLKKSQNFAKRRVLEGGGRKKPPRFNCVHCRAGGKRKRRPLKGGFGEGSPLKKTKKRTGSNCSRTQTVEGEFRKGRPQIKV